MRTFCRLTAALAATPSLAATAALAVGRGCTWLLSSPPELTEGVGHDQKALILTQQQRAFSLIPVNEGYCGNDSTWRVGTAAAMSSLL